LAAPTGKAGSASLSEHHPAIVAAIHGRAWEPEPVVEPLNEGVLAGPPDALSPFVEGYIGYRMEGYSPGIHRGLPGRHLTFIISLGGPVDIAAMPDRRHPPVAFDAFVAGYHDGPATIAHDGNQCGVGLDLTPAGARALLGFPASELAGIVVHLDDVFGRGADLQRDTLSDYAERIDHDVFLQQGLKADRGYGNRVFPGDQRR